MRLGRKLSEGFVVDTEADDAPTVDRPEVTEPAVPVTAGSRPESVASGPTPTG